MSGDSREARPTSIGCPGCAGVLSAASGSDGFAEYRCQIGHTYALPELLAAKERQLEHSLWSAMALLLHVQTITGVALDRADGTFAAAGQAPLGQRRRQAHAQLAQVERIIQETRVPSVW